MFLGCIIRCPSWLLIEIYSPHTATNVLYQTNSCAVDIQLVKFRKISGDLSEIAVVRKSWELWVVSADRKVYLIDKLMVRKSWDLDALLIF